MEIHDVLLAALIARFGDRGLRTGSPPRQPLAMFPARHPEVGDVCIGPEVSDSGEKATVAITIGTILGDTFSNYDGHVSARERAQRVTKDVVRFLQELFADRLLFWESTDGRHRGWRERGEAGHTEPLVLDNRTYRLYLWSGPLAEWQAVPAILGRGRVRDDREHQILRIWLRDGDADRAREHDRDLARRMLTEYERGANES